jgi:hypothetical protein
MALARVFTPQLRASLPEGWFAKESMTLLAPDGQANVIASSEPLDTSITAQRYAEIQGELLVKEFSGFRELRFQRTLILGGRPGYLRQFEWTPEDGVPVTQIQLYYAANGRGYTATATTPSSQFPRFERQLGEILADLALDVV